MGCWLLTFLWLRAMLATSLRVLAVRLATPLLLVGYVARRFLPILVRKILAVGALVILLLLRRLLLRLACLSTGCLALFLLALEALLATPFVPSWLTLGLAFLGRLLSIIRALLRLGLDFVALGLFVELAVEATLALTVMLAALVEVAPVVLARRAVVMNWLLVGHLSVLLALDFFCAVGDRLVRLALCAREHGFLGGELNAGLALSFAFVDFLAGSLVAASLMVALGPVLVLVLALVARLLLGSLLRAVRLHRLGLLICSELKLLRLFFDLLLLFLIFALLLSVVLGCGNVSVLHKRGLVFAEVN